VYTIKNQGWWSECSHFRCGVCCTNQVTPCLYEVGDVIPTHSRCITYLVKEPLSCSLCAQIANIITFPFNLCSGLIKSEYKILDSNQIQVGNLVKYNRSDGERYEVNFNEHASPQTKLLLLTTVFEQKNHHSYFSLPSLLAFLLIIIIILILLI